jgi:hypothetical protein
MLTKIVVICVGAAVFIAGVIIYRTQHVVAPTIIEQEARDSGVDYSIGIKYPFFSGVKHEYDLNGAIWATLTGKANVFKAAVRKANPRSLPVAHKSGLYIEYTPVVFNPQLVTVTFKITSYFTGDAHPSTTLETFSYDIENIAALPVIPAAQ